MLLLFFFNGKLNVHPMGVELTTSPFIHSCGSTIWAKAHWLVNQIIIHYSSFINQERKPRLYLRGHHSLKVQKTHQRLFLFYLLIATVLSMLRKAHILAFKLYNAYPRASKCISKLQRNYTLDLDVIIERKKVSVRSWTVPFHLKTNW